MQAASPAKSLPRENLWLRALHDYWSDPRNVIGPPGALVRRAFKLLWLVLSIYVLFWIAGPSQVASWRLWMEDDQLAEHIAWGFTFASALCFAIVGYAAEGSLPLRVPLLVPSIEFEEKQYKGWKIRPVHLHLPNVRVTLGTLLCVGLFSIALLGMWNFYLHEQQTAGGASVAAISGSTNRVEEAERALREFETRTAAAAAAATLAIQETSAGSPTGRSRLVRQQAEAARLASEERRALQTELREARAATVTTNQTFADPRPVDGQVAGATGLERGLVASLLDLLRSGVVEALLVMGAGLGVAGATSRIGVPAGGDLREPRAETETVAATTAVPEEAPPPAQAKRRYTLPVATDEDHALAAAIGPQAWEPPSAAVPEPEAAEPVADDPGAAEATIIPEAEAIIDPLVAEQLHGEREPA